MIGYVWLIAHPSKERRYATPHVPTGAWVDALLAEGYSVLRVQFDFPDDWDAEPRHLVEGFVAHKRCANCRHWQPIYTNGFGDCSRMENHQGDDLAKITGSDEAYLITKSDFGCVLWEESSSGR